MSESRSAEAPALPRWDLSDLYPAPDAPELAADLAEAERAAGAFAERYEGKLSKLDGDGLAAAITEFERIDEIMSRVMSHAGLLRADDALDPEIARFAQGAAERCNGIAARVIFFTLEINRLDDAVLDRLIDESTTLKRWRPWLRDVRALRPHQLSDEIEKLLFEKSVVGSASLVRLFDETIADLRFPIGGREVACAEIMSMMSDRSAAVRREAAETVGRVLGDNIRLFALVANSLAKDKEIEDRWRKFPRPISSRNLDNRVEDEVVDALRNAVRAAYPELSHRYYAMKARWFGGDKLDYWDRNAPLPEDDDREIPWGEAVETVLGAYARFSPEMAAIGRRFFDNPWIDAGARPGKSPGAFAHSTVPSVHPYLLLNYLGKTRDAQTLAHELGHGVHQVLAGGQGHFLSNTPLTLAETASVFGEGLTFRALLNRETDPKRRRVLLTSKVEDMLNTVVRQIAFLEFETRLHDRRREGELTPDEIGEVWIDAQTESLGPALRFDENYRHFWSYIPHFIHSPFYVYAYAFGDCLVNSLLAVYDEVGPDFVPRYLDMLRAGGTLGHRDLLAPFGLDAGDPAFWNKGLGVVRGYVDQLEALD